MTAICTLLVVDEVENTQSKACLDLTAAHHTPTADDEFQELCFEYGIELDDVVCAVYCWWSQQLLTCPCALHLTTFPHHAIHTHRHQKQRC